MGQAGLRHDQPRKGGRSSWPSFRRTACSRRIWTSVTSTAPSPSFVTSD